MSFDIENKCVVCPPGAASCESLNSAIQSWSSYIEDNCKVCLGSPISSYDPECSENLCKRNRHQYQLIVSLLHFDQRLGFHSTSSQSEYWGKYPKQVRSNWPQNPWTMSVEQCCLRDDLGTLHRKWAALFWISDWRKIWKSVWTITFFIWEPTQIDFCPL